MEGGRGGLKPADSCSSSANRSTVEAFPNAQCDQTIKSKTDAGVEEEPPQSVAESAEPEQMTTRLQQKMSRRPTRKGKGGRFYRRVATVVGTSSLIAFFRVRPNQIKKSKNQN